MKTELETYDFAERLNSETEIEHYLAAAFEDGDPALIKAALGDVARARGMSEVARQAGLSRAGIYRALGDDGNPSLESLSGILGAFGMQLSVRKSVGANVKMRALSARPRRTAKQKDPA